MKKPVVLCILDGFGIGDGGKFDAVAQANAPVWNDIKRTAPGATLSTHGLDVGLPEGQMGNSEVGHMNIGAGRVVMQYLPRIDHAFKYDTFDEIQTFRDLVEKTQNDDSTCHVMGLVSDGGVHAHIDHITETLKILDMHSVKTAMHAFTDGRDTPPQSAKDYLHILMSTIDTLDHVDIATLSGRYYAMDRDHRWDRVQKAYDAMMVCGEYETADNVFWAIENAYEMAVTDEFILPTVIGDFDGIKDGDTILFTNFRSDRAREILTALLDPDFAGFTRERMPKIAMASGFVQYSDDLNPFMSALFPPLKKENILGEVVANAGLNQLRIAETEKYPHVTFFFNSGREEPYAGESRILVNSPNVATYDQQPEMSAAEVTDKLLEALDSDAYDLVILNFANPDMVGHTGNLGAVEKAIEAVDEGLGRIKDKVLEKQGVLIVCADHGNAETMWDEENNSPHTAHTTNLVPIHIVGVGDAILKNGKLADIAPTILKLLGIEQPKEMTGENLL